MTRAVTHFSTLHVVLQEVENVLSSYPKHPYQSAFLIPELHQKLITTILKYPPLSDHPPEEIQPLHHPLSLGDRLKIQLVVRASILHIMRENSDWLNRHFLTASRSNRTRICNPASLSQSPYSIHS